MATAETKGRRTQRPLTRIADIMTNWPPLFVAKISVDRKTGCWNWTGATHSPARYPERKYGEFHLGRVNGKSRVINTHRFVYELVHGPLLDLRLDVDHKCRNSLCVNPKHLRAITHQDNLRLRRFGGEL